MEVSTTLSKERILVLQADRLIPHVIKMHL